MDDAAERERKMKEANDKAAKVTSTSKAADNEENKDEAADEFEEPERFK